MIENIKQEMQENIGREVKVIFNSGRNKIEEYDAIIAETYKSIFVVQLNNDISEYKSFTYSDVLTETVKINLK